MDVTGMLLRAGGSRPHVLIAAMPGATEVRLAAEEQLRRRGWPRALTPADTDVLLVAGTAEGDIADAVRAAWAAVPAPRVRADAARPGEVSAVLDAARAGLTNAAAQRRAAANGSGNAAEGANGHGVRNGHDAGQAQQGHGTGGMGMPGGLAMADRGADRDGLKLDQLHVPLGPVLRDWPAGLVVRLTLQGDVVQQAEAGFIGVPAAGGSFWAEPWRRAEAGEPVSAGEAARRRVAAHLDSLGRFLAVAGWDGAAAAARRLRDEALSGAPAGRLRPAAGRLAARVARSRLLAWSTRGIGLVGRDDVAGHPGGDVTARYRCWCEEAAELAGRVDDTSPLADSGIDPPRGGQHLELLPGLLQGAEFAAARLIIASLDPDADGG